MRSDYIKKGPMRAPTRALFYGMGYTEEELEKPLIGIVNSQNEIVAGHVHLDRIAQAAKIGVAMAGGTPIEFPAIGICDGIAMGHLGMKYPLASRELIADSIEAMVMAHGFDGLVLIPNCDKIVPGMMMAAQVIKMLEDNIKPRDIMTREAFENAITVDMGMAGSSNTVLHLPAIAHEAELELELDIFDEISAKTPCLCKLSPSGFHHMQDLHEAGGIPALMNELSKLDLLHVKTFTVSG